MDFTKTKHPIDGTTQIIFTVRDLASHYHLCWLPVADETAATIIPILHRLFEEHGAPLVLKSDNGSAFIAEDANDLLRAWCVLALFSPPRLPKYNGALERSNTTLKVYTHTSAVSDGHPFRWTSDDLARAVTVANEFSRPWGASGPTPAERWQSRAAITAQERCQLSDLVQPQREVACVDLGFSAEPLAQLSAADRRAVDRMAIARCLQQLGQLTTKPVRHPARKPKRPDSEHRERWFEQPPRASSALPSPRPAARLSEKDSRVREKKSLARDQEGATMPACPTVSDFNAATPHDLPPKRCARAIFNWLRRPITLLVSLAKAARIT
jgi:transposase InsO family protein